MAAYYNPVSGTPADQYLTWMKAQPASRTVPLGDPNAPLGSQFIPASGYRPVSTSVPGDPNAPAPQSADPNADPFAGYRVPNLDLSQIGQYMDPYRQQVIDAAIAELNRQQGIDIAGNADRGIAAHAFGGDRQAIADAQIQDAYARAKANTVANLNSAGWNNAINYGQTARGQDITQNDAFLNAGLVERGQNIGAADTASNILYRSGLADWTSINQGAGAVGTGGNSTTTTTGPGSNPWLTLVGSLITGYGLSQPPR